MDPLLVAASVAGVAAIGVQLSQTIYDLITTFYEAEKEMSSIANDLSLLAMVLNELEGVLQRDSRVYRRRMVRVVNEILKNCHSVFQSISKHVSMKSQDMRFSKQFQRNLLWFFQQHQVRPLQAGLQSMKSTLDVLLHVVHLARVTEAAQSFIHNAGAVFTQADIQKERKILVGVVLDNRRSILSLKEIEEDRDRGHNLRYTIEGTDRDVTLDDHAPKTKRDSGRTGTAESGGSNSFGGWGGGSNANTGTNTSVFSKAKKDSATDTTYSQNWSFYGNKGNREDKVLTTGSDSERSGLFDENKYNQTIEHDVEGGEDWGAFPITAIKKKDENKKKVPFDEVGGVPNHIVIDAKFENTQAATDDSWSAGGVASSGNKKGKNRKEGKKENQKETESSIRRSRDATPDLSVPARPASQAEYVEEFHEVSEVGSRGSRPTTFNGSPKRGHDNGTDDPPNPSESQEDSHSQSYTSEYHSMPPDVPNKYSIEPHYSEEDLAMKPRRSQITANRKGLAAISIKSQGSPSGMELVTPNVQWFLSVVPHESSVVALIARPRSGEDNLKARAEKTVRTLLLNWTNLDPDMFSEEENYGYWNSNDTSGPYFRSPAMNERLPIQPHQVSIPPGIAYPTYAPQQWYPQPVIAAPPPLVRLASNETQTDSEELSRLKKLILDEKAEQDMRAAIVAAVVPPSPATNVAPIASDGFPEDSWQYENTYMETEESIQRPQGHSALWKAEPPRPQPVIMRDWLGRKFIFPVDKCQTWEGLHNLILEAFRHVIEHRSMVEKGCYDMSHVTGEVILPSTWELFVEPGLEINMELWNVADADRDESGGKRVMSGRRDHAGPKTLISPHTLDEPTLGDPIALRSKNDNESSINDIADDETDCSFSENISYVGRSDPRYQSIEGILLEQKAAKIEAELKLERNRRFFQLKQQLVDQGAAIQARHDAADRAEQDAKLAWLEKQVRDQKEELDRLPPLLKTPPGSITGDSLDKSANSPQRRPSFGARLLDRMPSWSNRSRGSVTS